MFYKRSCANSIFRRFALTTLFGWVTFVFGQNCKCESDSSLAEIISCDTIQFDNRAKVYWNFNCDSSWLVFETSIGKKETIFSLNEGLQHLTGRLGYIFAQEYNKTFLIQNNVISGCCTPPDYYLYNKENGKCKTYLGNLIFYSQGRENPIAIGITDSNNDTSTLPSYNSLTIYNLEKGTKRIVELPINAIRRAMNVTKRNYPEHLFNEPIIKGDMIILTYYYKQPKSSSDKPIKTIRIDLKEYK